MQQTRKLEMWVGSFVVLGLCAILFMIFQVADVKGLGSGDTYTLEARFDNIGSLKVRSPRKGWRGGDWSRQRYFLRQRELPPCC